MFIKLWLSRASINQNILCHILLLEQSVCFVLYLAEQKKGREHFRRILIALLEIKIKCKYLKIHIFETLGARHCCRTA